MVTTIEIEHEEVERIIRDELRRFLKDGWGLLTEEDEQAIARVIKLYTGGVDESWR